MTRKFSSSPSSISQAELPDLRSQTFITLWLLLHFFILLYTLYTGPYDTFLLAESAIFLASIVFIGWKFNYFLRYKDRGQRTACFGVSMGISFLATVGCAYFYRQEAELSLEIAALFGMGFLLFAMTLFQSLRPIMVKGNVILHSAKTKRRPKMKKAKRPIR